MVKLGMIFLLMTSCSHWNFLGTRSVCSQSAENYLNSKDDTKLERKDQEKKSLENAFKIQALSLVNCYKNFLKFEKEKKEKKVCVLMAVNRQGKTIYAKASNEAESIPKPLKMCIEQQLWKMNFAHVSLKRSVSLKKLINFQPF
jgi:dihydroorotase-like cyclic amidohydrolase